MLVGAGALYSRERYHNLEARSQLLTHQAAFDDAQLFFDDRNQSASRHEETLLRLHGLLERYGVNDEPDEKWMEVDTIRRLPADDQSRLRGDIGEIYYLMAETAAFPAA